MARYIFYYQYHTRHGTVSLVPEPDGRYNVMFRDEHLGSYPSAVSAADDVSGGYTDPPPDDVDFGELDIPEDLGEWERRVFARIRR